VAAAPAVSLPATPPPTTQSAAPAAAMTPTAGRPVPAHQGLWRVVAWTYDQQGEAEKKAQTIASKYPQFAPAVFSPGGNGKQYLVTLGGAMDREESFKVRAAAIRAGLPGDTYARNFHSGTVVSQVVVPLK
jgi:eukaryotic-like serine/threonine-protein kinase